MKPKTISKMQFYGLRMTPEIMAQVKRAAKRDREGVAEWMRNAITERLAKGASK